MPSNLDPNPGNLLGCGILDPDLEAQLLAEGVVYVDYIVQACGNRILNTSRRPWAEVVRRWTVSERFVPMLPPAVTLSEPEAEYA